MNYDKVRQKLFGSFRRLADTHSDVMFVISQLQYDDYLIHSSQAAALNRLPRPGSMKESKYRRGDFDFLILHRRAGIIAIEVKTVGASRMFWSMTEQYQDQSVHKRAEKALAQLQRCGDVLRHLVCDQTVPPRIRQTVCFPCITPGQFQRVLRSDQQLRQVCMTE